MPTRTPWPTRAPTPILPDLLTTATVGDPYELAAAVATLVSRAADTVETLGPTPEAR